MRRLVTTAVIGLVFVFATSAVAEPLATDAAAVKKKKKCFKKKHGKRVRVKCPKKKKPATQTPTTQTPTTTTPTTPTSDPVRERFLFLMSGEMLKYFANGSDPGGIQSDATMHFCSNKSYSYYGQTVIAVPGGGSTSQQSEQGAWEVTKTELSAAGDEILGIIHLTPSNGAAPYDVQINLVDNGDGTITTYMGGTRWFRVASDACT